MNSGSRERIVCFLDAGLLPDMRVLLRVEVDAAERAVFRAGPLDPAAEPPDAEPGRVA